MNNGEHRNGKEHDANVIGPKIRYLRSARGWSQSQFAVELQLRGLDVGRDVVARIEGKTHCIKDKHIPTIARVLGVRVSDLFSGFE
jgi:transcriptional regulator with XRE-family HTH domain